VVIGAPGLYVLGLPVLRTRASTYIHGADADTDALAKVSSALISVESWRSTARSTLKYSSKYGRSVLASPPGT
jgi:hypothetical protein